MGGEGALGRVSRFVGLVWSPHPADLIFGVFVLFNDFDCNGRSKKFGFRMLLLIFVSEVVCNILSGNARFGNFG